VTPKLSEVATKPKFKPQSKRLIDQVREVLRYHHYAIRTEEAYVRWILAFIRFHGRKHPGDMGKTEIEAFLSDLAVNGNCARSTQSQALNSIVFLYKQVLDLPVAKDLAPIRSKKPVRLPVVMSRDEVSAVMGQMGGKTVLMAGLMYGGGLRLMEVLRLRIHDLDFANAMILVRDGKGGRERSTLLATSLVKALKSQLAKVEGTFKKDLADGHANVWLPNALARKYPNAPGSWEWQYVFPAQNLSTDPRSGQIRRHHMNESNLQKAVKKARTEAGISKRVTSHTFRHSFATHLLESGTNIRVVQKLLGHADIKTTEIYTHVLQQNLAAVRSPLDELGL